MTLAHVRHSQRKTKDESQGEGRRLHCVVAIRKTTRDD